jgi:hypothetical protein
MIGLSKRQPGWRFFFILFVSWYSPLVAREILIGFIPTSRPEGGIF